MDKNKRRQVAKNLRIVQTLLYLGTKDLEKQIQQAKRLTGANNVPSAKIDDFLALAVDVIVTALIGALFIVVFAASEWLLHSLVEQPPHYLKTLPAFFEQCSIGLILGYLFLSLAIDLAGKVIIKVQALYCEITKGGDTHAKAHTEADSSEG